MESAIRHQYDASLALRAPGSADITATAATPGLDLYRITRSARGANDGRYGIGSFDLVLFIKSIDTTTGNETYSFAVQVSDTVSGSYEDVQTIAVNADVIAQPLVFAFHPKTLKLVSGDDAGFLRLNATLGGTTPILNYWAFLAPHSHA